MGGGAQEPLSQPRRKTDKQGGPAPHRPTLLPGPLPSTQATKGVSAQRASFQWVPAVGGRPRGARSPGGQLSLSAPQLQGHPGP